MHNVADNSWNSTITNTALYQLMTWFSPSYPIGSFSYSHGIEYATENHIIFDMQSLIIWISGIIQYGTGRNDAMLFKASYEFFDSSDLAIIKKKNNKEIIDYIIVLSNVLKSSPEFWQESTRQGEAAIKILLATYNPANIYFLQQRLNKINRLPTIAVVFGSASANYKIPLNIALTAYLHSFVSNLVVAAIKLVPLGHTDGQNAMLILEKIIKQTVDIAIKSQLEEIGSATPMVDWTSVQHETQYSRLFQS